MAVLAVGVAAEASAATLPVRLSFEYPNGTKGGVLTATDEHVIIPEDYADQAVIADYPSPEFYTGRHGYPEGFGPETGYYFEVKTAPTRAWFDIAIGKDPSTGQPTDGYKVTSEPLFVDFLADLQPFEDSDEPDLANASPLFQSIRVRVREGSVFTIDDSIYLYRYTLWDYNEVVTGANWVVVAAALENGHTVKKRFVLELSDGTPLSALEDGLDRITFAAEAVQKDGYEGLAYRVYINGRRAVGRGQPEFYALPTGSARTGCVRMAGFTGRADVDDFVYTLTPPAFTRSVRTEDQCMRIVPGSLPHVVYTQDPDVDFAIDSYGKDWRVNFHYGNGHGYVETARPGELVNNWMFGQDRRETEGVGDVFRFAFRYWRTDQDGRHVSFYGWVSLTATETGELSLLASEVCEEENVAVVGRSEPLPEEERAVVEKWNVIDHGDWLELDGRCIPNGKIAGRVVIPDLIDGKPVRGIGPYAFQGYLGITQIVIPNGIEWIGDGAFQNCRSLKELYVPYNVTNVGTQAIADCDALGTVRIDANLSTFNNKAFAHSGMTNLVLGSAIRIIDNYAFADNRRLQSVTFPSGIERICTWSFDENCLSLKEVCVPAQTVVEDEAFPPDCVVSRFGPEPERILTDEFEGREWRYVVRGGCAVILPFEAEGWLTVPGELGGLPVRNIPDGFFANCSNLVDVVLFDSITNIGAYAFYNCVNLKNIKLGYGLVSIRSGAFGNCKALEGVSLPDSMRTLGDWLAVTNDLARISSRSGSGFETNEVEKTEYGSVETYRKAAYESGYCGNHGLGVFEGCSALREVHLNSGLVQIGAGAFRDCTALQKLDVPGTVRRIGGVSEELFSSINTTQDISREIQTFGELDPVELFQEDIRTSDAMQLSWFGSGFLQGCVALESVCLPDGLEYLGPYAFAGCTKLEGVELPDGLSEVYQGTFSGCRKLMSVKLPRWLELLGASEKPHTHLQVFTSEIRSNCGVPSAWVTFSSSSEIDGVITDYYMANGGQPSETSRETDDTRWIAREKDPKIPEVDPGLMWFNSTPVAQAIARIGGAITTAQWDELVENRSRFYPESSRYGSESGVFSGCTSLRSIELRDGLARIGDWTFYDCCNLTSIELPQSVKLLGYEVFGGESSLLNITTPLFPCGELMTIFPSHEYVANLVLTSSAQLFVEPWQYMQEQLVECGCVNDFGEIVVIPAWVIERIVNDLLKKFNLASMTPWREFWSLRSVAFPEGLEGFDVSIEWPMCEKLQSVKFPRSLQFVGDYGFHGCSVETVRLPSLTALGAYAFVWSNVGNLIFEGNAPANVSNDALAEEGFWDDSVREDLTVNVYPGTTGWDGEPGSAALPEDGLWPTSAAIYKRRPIRYVDQPLSAALGGEGGTDALTFFDAKEGKLVAVPQTWLDEYGLLSVDAFGGVGVADLAPVASRSLYDSYVAGLDPTDESQQFTAKIEIVDGQVEVSWSPKLPPEKEALREYTIYGSPDLNSYWVDYESLPDYARQNMRYFKVGVRLK